jgi:hypothetical protein
VDVFLSHSSEDRDVAAAVEGGLEDLGFHVWLDDSDIAVGMLLGPHLQENIVRSRVLLLLWSVAAETSRWVRFEWLTAIHSQRFVIPCLLDGTPLPQCLRSAVHLRFGDAAPVPIRRIARAISAAPDRRNPLAPVMRWESPELEAAIAEIRLGQSDVLDHLDRNELESARIGQTALDSMVEDALSAWPVDPVVSNLAAYHAKNAYMVRYWAEIQAGRVSGDDHLLAVAEDRFLDSLALDPTDPGALNGLATILFYRFELNAAEFFIRATLRESDLRGLDYRDAKRDLEMVRRVISNQPGRQGAGRNSG